MRVARSSFVLGSYPIDRFTPFSSSVISLAFVATLIGIERTISWVQKITVYISTSYS